MKKIAIVTFNDAYNYGAFLQEYALQTYITNIGNECDVIDYENTTFRQTYKYSCNVLKKKGIKNKIKIILNFIRKPKTMFARMEQIKKFEDSISKEISHSKKFNRDEVDALNSKYDYFISGSDQVWNFKITSHNTFYLLDFVNDKKKKLSYAASFGKKDFSEDDLKIFSKELSNFSSLLVREEDGKDILAKCNLKSNVVLDPTFLLDKEQWQSFANKSNVSCLKKYIFVYLIARQTNLLDAAIKYAKENDLEIILISNLNSDIVHNGTKIKAVINAGPYDFMNYLINAECVFTTSFHGLVLSINLNKKFYYELSKAKNNNNSRLINIVNMFNLENREITDKGIVEENIDWDFVNEKLEIERLKSSNLLQESIKD